MYVSVACATRFIAVRTRFIAVRTRTPCRPQPDVHGPVLCLPWLSALGAWCVCICAWMGLSVLTGRAMQALDGKIVEAEQTYEKVAADKPAKKGRKKPAVEAAASEEPTP